MESVNLEYESTRAFLNRLIDYAGLFPPASLSLEKAISNYIQYKQSNDSWMLGTFILPASLLEEFGSIVSNMSTNLILPISLTGMKSANLVDCRMAFHGDLQKLARYRKNHEKTFHVEAFELPMPLSVPKVEDVTNLAVMAEVEEMFLFCEVTIDDKEDWEEQLKSTLDVFATYNETTTKPIGVKLRTGGLEAKMFPSLEKVSSFLTECGKRKLPLKFTAGLHHPIRMYRDEVQTKMHGFVNVFTAALFAYSGQLGREQLIELLNDEDANQFHFMEHELSWREYKIRFNDIKKYRKLLFSYGSCSFDEPRLEFRDMKLKKEASN